jgi:hypothetical protein
VLAASLGESLLCLGQQWPFGTKAVLAADCFCRYLDIFSHGWFEQSRMAQHVCRHICRTARSFTPS